MLVTRAADLRKNQKEYLDKAYNGNTVIISRPQNKNVVIISEAEYNKMQLHLRIFNYATKLFKEKPGLMEKTDFTSEKDLAMLRLLMELEERYQSAEKEGWVSEEDMEQEMKHFFSDLNINA